MTSFTFNKREPTSFISWAYLPTSRFFVTCLITGTTVYSSRSGRETFSFAARGVYGTHVLVNKKYHIRTPSDIRVERNGETIPLDRLAKIVGVQL